MISSAAATGMILGPLLGGGMAELWGNRWAFASAGIIVLLATILIIFFRKRGKFQSKQGKRLCYQRLSHCDKQPPILACINSDAYGQLFYDDYRSDLALIHC